jgi:hypothetical protein
VNITQRTPHESKEIAEDTEEFNLLKGIMEDIMEFIRANVFCPVFFKFTSNNLFKLVETPTSRSV